MKSMNAYIVKYYIPPKGKDRRESVKLLIPGADNTSVANENGELRVWQGRAGLGDHCIIKSIQVSDQFAKDVLAFMEAEKKIRKVFVETTKQ